MENILILIPLNDDHKQKINEITKPFDCCITYSSSQEVTDEQIQSATIILGNAPSIRIKESTNLKFLQLNSAGADAYVRPGILSSKTLLANSTGAYGKAVSEHCFAMQVALQKKIPQYRDKQKLNQWSDLGDITSFADATVLIIGLGDIGSRYAKICHSLGSYTIGVKRRNSQKPDYLDELYTTDKVDELLPRADVVVNFMPSTKETTHFYSKSRFEMMKKTAIFINGGRGSAVSNDVLYEVLKDGIISAAGVDVVEGEPLSPDSPLWQLDNLLLTPHISGNYHLKETYDNVVSIALTNLDNYLNNRPIMNEVDFLTGYKK